MRIPFSFMLFFTFALAGCANHPARDASPYQTVGKDPRRDAELARQENARALAYLEQNDYEKAEIALKSALAADIMCGPAHNNLGKVYFYKAKTKQDPGTPWLYLAAWEFQYAQKLIPNQAEPLNNLGLVFEVAGKLDEATESYNKAVSLEPENVNAMGNLARARIRRRDHDDSVRVLLQRLIERDTRPEWLKWERNELTRLQARRAS